MNVRNASLASAALLAAGLLASAAAPSASRPSPAPGERVVSVPGTPGVEARLRALGLDLLMKRDGRVFVVTGPGDAAVLRGLGLSWRTERALPAGAPDPGPASAAAGGLNGDFHSYSETEAELRALADAYPGVTSLRSLGTSLEGRTIRALKIGAQAEYDLRRPALVVLGCHHAREWISVEVPLRFARGLLESSASDAAARAVLARIETWVVPVVNPDGLEYSIRTYRMWRKNRRLVGRNVFGVDLNRNYGFMWGFDEEGSSGTPASEVYRGAAPFSEPETAAVRRLVASLDLKALVSYHSYAADILYPWGYAPVPSGRDADMNAIAARMAELIRAVNGRSYVYGEAAAALYATNGDLTDWAFATTGAPAFTIELPPVEFREGGFLNAEADILPIYLENRPALMYLASLAAAQSPVPPPAAEPGRNPVRRPGPPGKIV